MYINLYVLSECLLKSFSKRHLQQFFVCFFRAVLFPSQLPKNSTQEAGVENFHTVLDEQPQSTHRVATAAFWSTFHHDGKISPGCGGGGGARPPPSRIKLQCTLQLSGQIHSPYFISTPMYSTLCDQP
jgi:hypothetical protein